MEHLQIWSQFALAAALIIFAGVKLTKYGDILSERLNLGHAFIGAVLIGWSTSLPELVLSIGTAVYAEAPNITMGNVLGSNLFNIFIIVLLDFAYRHGAVLRTVDFKSMTSTSLSLIMIIIAGIILYCNRSQIINIGFVDTGFSKIGYDSILIFVAYMACMLVLFRSDKSNASEEHSVKKYDHISTKSVLLKCLMVILIIVVAGLWLSVIAKKINIVYKLDEGFVGSFFLAIVSSLPEVMTCFVAIRLGFNNMALGTLFGSNIFNIGIIAFCDIFYKERIFSTFDATHYIAVVFVILMTFVTMGTLKYKHNKPAKYFGFESIVIGSLYFVAIYSIYNPSWFQSITGG